MIAEQLDLTKMFGGRFGQWVTLFYIDGLAIEGKAEEGSPLGQFEIRIKGCSQPGAVLPIPGGGWVPLPGSGGWFEVGTQPKDPVGKVLIRPSQGRLVGEVCRCDTPSRAAGESGGTGRI